MSKIYVWFRAGASFKTLFMYLPLLIILLAACTYGGVFLGSQFYTDALVAHGRVLQTQIAPMSGGEILFLTAGVLPVIEEAVFRVVPFCLLFGLLWLFKLKETKAGIVLAIIGIVVTSLIFGLAHGPRNYFIQGPTGVILAVVYMKWSAFGSGFLATLKGWAASALVHGSYNAVLMLIFITLR